MISFFRHSCKERKSYHFVILWHMWIFIPLEVELLPAIHTSEGMKIWRNTWVAKVSPYWLLFPYLSEVLHRFHVQSLLFHQLQVDVVQLVPLHFLFLFTTLNLVTNTGYISQNIRYQWQNQGGRGFGGFNPSSPGKKSSAYLGVSLWFVDILSEKQCLICLRLHDKTFGNQKFPWEQAPRTLYGKISF